MPVQKIVVLGNDRSGKTRFCTSVFGNNARISEVRGYTEGFQVFTVRTPTAEVELWDTGRDGLRPAYFLEARAGIILASALETALPYIHEMTQFAPDAPYIIVNQALSYNANQIVAGLVA